MAFGLTRSPEVTPSSPPLPTTFSERRTPTKACVTRVSAQKGRLEKVANLADLDELERKRGLKVSDPG